MRKHLYYYFMITLFISISARNLIADNLYVWYGNPDDSVINAEIGELVNIDIYTQTDESIWIADMHLALGADDACFDSLLSEYNGDIYYPLTLWDYVEFQPPDGSPPNPEGWSNQSLLAFAELWPPYESNWLHFEMPTLTLKMVFRAANDSSLIGQTVDCLGPGLNWLLGPSGAGDTMMQVDVVEYYSPVFFTGLVSVDEPELPENFQLFQNYPNPFNGSTKISYQLSENSRVKLEIFDISGRKVAEPIDRYQQSGYHEIQWRPDVSASGIYFCRLTTYRGTQIRKMIYLK